MRVNGDMLMVPVFCESAMIADLGSVTTNGGNAVGSLLATSGSKDKLVADVKGGCIL